MRMPATHSTSELAKDMHPGSLRDSYRPAALNEEIADACVNDWLCFLPERGHSGEDSQDSELDNSGLVF